MRTNVELNNRALTRIEKLNAIAAARNIDAFILTSPASVKYFSGFYFYFEYGSSPFQLLPATLVAVPGGSCSLVVADNELDQTDQLPSSLSIIPYESYTYLRPSDFTNALLTRLHELLKDNRLFLARIGVELNELPASIAYSLHAKFPGIECIDITTEIANLKAIKDEDEIALIRAACNLCDIGQAAVIKYAKPGISELELFAELRCEIESFANARVPLMADLVSGERTSKGGGMPSTNIIKHGDLVLSDLTPCLDGYWGDSCNTIVIGEATVEQSRKYKRVKQALDAGIATVRPGVQAKEIDRVMREYAGDFPHHGGHGVGIRYHEEPRIVPYNDTILEPGMIIALEPAIYEKAYGIRLEHLVAVTETGCELITKFEHSFYTC